MCYYHYKLDFNIYNDIAQIIIIIINRFNYGNHGFVFYINITGWRENKFPLTPLKLPQIDRKIVHENFMQHFNNKKKIASQLIKYE
jgi:hypothetical protein